MVSIFQAFQEDFTGVGEEHKFPAKGVTYISSIHPQFCLAEDMECGLHVLCPYAIAAPGHQCVRTTENLDLDVLILDAEYFEAVEHIHYCTVGELEGLDAE